VLRARTSVLVAQIRSLRDLLREPAVQARTRGWFVGQCQDIDGLDAFIESKLTTIHAVWKPYRQDRPQPAGMTESDRVNLYRTAVRVAQRALCALRVEPELSRVVDSGIAATDLFEINVACRQIDTVLCLRIDVEPGRRRAPTTRTICVDTSTTEKR